MKNLLLLSALCLLMACVVKPKACIDKVCFDVEIVQTNETRARGLSGREKLKDHQGMLFVFDAPARHGFWMKEMKFDLDIIWLDQNGRVVGIKENFTPCTPNNCPSYKPLSEAVYVLEINAGLAQKYNIKEGSVLHFFGL